MQQLDTSSVWQVTNQEQIAVNRERKERQITKYQKN